MKSTILITLLFLFFSITACSQNKETNKKTFAYKTVEGHEIKANIFLPDSEGLYPVLIYFHGGGFIFGNRDQGLHQGLRDKLLASKYAVISADYRLAPETKLEGMIEDVNDLIAWIKNNGEKKFKINTNKIAVTGGSAGGYLAYAAGFDKKHAPNVIISISSPTGFSPGNIEMGDLSVREKPGPYDIVKKGNIISYGDYDSRLELWRFLARNRLSLYEIFGFDPSVEPQKLENYKLTNNIDSNYPPTLLVQAKNDRLVPNNTVEEFLNFLQETGVESELFQVENGHSNELLNQNPQVLDKIVQFLDTNLK